MPDTLQKLRPDRDLQCYFFQPSAIAAFSGATPTGFTLSGSWRQQFDWAVVEWNRDNVFEHPMFRSLPDGDLSGLTLSYEETRSNCIPLDSKLFATVDWPTLRVWADDGTGEKVYKIPLYQPAYAVPIEGSFQPASAQITLDGTVTVGDVVGFAFLDEHYSYVMTANPLEFAVQNLVDGVNAFSNTVAASQSGTTIQLTYLGTGNQSTVASTTGANGNRLGLYTYTSGSQTEQWDVTWKQFTGGLSPSKWRITLPFGSLKELPGKAATSIRKMRWTYAADLQPGAFARGEFQVTVSNWNVTGAGQTYSIAGPGSRRINDDSTALTYSPITSWTNSTGNFSGGTIHLTSAPLASFYCRYTSAQTHSLYLGTRIVPSGPAIQVTIDGQAVPPINLNFPGEDVLVRYPLGQFGPGDHTLQATHAGKNGEPFYFDFLEIALPTAALPTNTAEPRLTLATDWDTEHCIALAPERTAWMIDSLGFKGRANHYVGALWFYELVSKGNRYSSGTISFSGAPDPNASTLIYVGQVPIQHLNLEGDTPESLAKAFELQINNGFTAVWAQANGSQLTIFSRSMGKSGDLIPIDVSPSTPNLTTSKSGPTLSGGQDGDWRTDLTSIPRVNRAARDWTRSFCAALKSYGLDSVATALSMEIQHGDPSPDVGIAQRYPSQVAVTVNTPALQTNFSPQSTAFWQQAHLDLAQVQNEAGLAPYVQFGEVQWWYFPEGFPRKDATGMPFYDQYTTSAFKAQYGRDLTPIPNSAVDPATIPQEAAFLPSLIGAFTNAIIAFVGAVFPLCRFEVLYPTDVNDSILNRVINYPVPDWTADKLTCLKTESFTYTFNRNLDLSAATIAYGQAKGFPSSKRSHLVGIEDSSTAWRKETRMAEARQFDSVVLFALDQFCLIGYPLPLSRGMRRGVRLG